MRFLFEEIKSNNEIRVMEFKFYLIVTLNKGCNNLNNITNIIQ